MTGQKIGTVRIEGTDGRLRLRWTYQGKRYSFSIGLADTKTNRRAAQHLVLEIEADLESGQFDPTLGKYRRQRQQFSSASISAPEVFEKWLKFKAATCDPRTIDWYRHTQRNLEQFFGDRPAIQIDAIAANDFVGWLRRQGLAKETQQRRLEAVTSCWRWAVKMHILPSSHWEGLSKLIVVPEPVPQPFTEEEVEKIIEGFEESGRYRQLLPFVQFLLGTGVRVGEGIGLRWEHVSPDCSRVTICEQLTKGKRKPTKGKGKIRILKLNSQISELLQALKPANPTGVVFRWNGKPINLDRFRARVWERILNEKGVEYRPPYECRSTFISHCLESGMNPVKVAKITGHRLDVLFKHYANNIALVFVPDLYSLSSGRV